jgi:peroxiredoxin
MALMYSDMQTLGSDAPDFNLPGVDGRDWSLADFNISQIVVIMFICNHCPYVKAIQTRLVQLQSEFSPEDVRLIGISANDADDYPEDSFTNMQKVARDKHFNFPYLYDAEQVVARAYGAVCTPDFFVYDKERKLRYRGRLDDNWQNPDLVTSRDLFIALQQLLAGKKIDFEQKPSMGCSIKWKN